MEAIAQCWAKKAGQTGHTFRPGLRQRTAVRDQGTGRARLG